MSDGGKGDKPRPIPDRKGYEQRFDAIDWMRGSGMACKACMKARAKAAERMGLANYNRLLGKRFPLAPEDERRLSTPAASHHAGGDSEPAREAGPSGAGDSGPGG